MEGLALLLLALYLLLGNALSLDLEETQFMMLVDQDSKLIS